MNENWEASKRLFICDYTGEAGEPGLEERISGERKPSRDRYLLPSQIQAKNCVSVNEKTGGQQSASRILLGLTRLQQAWRANKLDKGPQHLRAGRV